MKEVMTTPAAIAAAARTAMMITVEVMSPRWLCHTLRTRCANAVRAEIANRWNLAVAFTGISGGSLLRAF